MNAQTIVALSKALPRILLGEDDAVFALPLLKILERRGYRVIRVDNGNDALSCMGEADLLLLDVGLPGRDGFELAEHATLRFPGLPVILMSGRHDFGEVPEPLGRSIRGFLSKPFNLEELIELLRRACPA